jgi:hypothetical protein
MLFLVERILRGPRYDFHVTDASADFEIVHRAKEWLTTPFAAPTPAVGTATPIIPAPPDNGLSSFSAST